MDPQPDYESARLEPWYRTTAELLGGPADGRFVELSDPLQTAIEVETVRGFSVYRRVPESDPVRFVYATWRTK